MATIAMQTRVPLATRASTPALRVSRVAPRPAAPEGLTGVLRAPLATPRRTVARREVAATHVVAATGEGNFDEGIAGYNDYSPLLAAVTYAAVWFGKFNVDKVKVLHALAALQLFVTAINLVSRHRVGDNVAQFVGPATLAAAILSIRHVQYLDVASLLFGYFISGSLENITGVPFYGFVATLAIAVYLGYGTLWVVAAFGLASAGKIYNATKENSPVPLAVAPALFATAWAIYKEQHFKLALCIYLALTVWSGFGATLGLINKLKDS